MSYESILQEMIPLQERRDYGKNLDFVEQNALKLVEEGYKIPINLELRLKQKHHASIIDYPQKTLCSFIWDSSENPHKIKSEVRNKILNDLYSVLDDNFESKEKWITEVTITGSIATNQYNKNTDVDVNVSIDYDVFRTSNLNITEHINDDHELRLLIREKVYILNGKKLAGDHLVKYFVIEKGKRLESDAVYDLIQDKWIKSPVLIESWFDPDSVFIDAKSRALEIIKEILSKIFDIKASIIDLIRKSEANQCTVISRFKIVEAINELASYKDCFKKMRTIRFKQESVQLLGYALSKNWEFNNVVFKYVEKYGFKEPLNVLKSVLSEQELNVIQFTKKSVIKKCPKKDKTPDRPKSEQNWCLYDSKGERLLGRHPTKEKAKNQEKAIQIHKHQ